MWAGNSYNRTLALSYLGGYRCHKKAHDNSRRQDGWFKRAIGTTGIPRHHGSNEYNMLLHKRVDLPYSELRDCGEVAYVGHVEFAEGLVGDNHG